MRKKVSPLPSQRKARNRLRRVPVKLGARTLMFYRPIFRLGPFRIMRGADGSLFWRWKQGRHHRLNRTATTSSQPTPLAERRPARSSE